MIEPILVGLSYPPPSQLQFHRTDWSEAVVGRVLVMVVVLMSNCHFMPNLLLALCFFSIAKAMPSICLPIYTYTWAW